MIGTTDSIISVVRGVSATLEERWKSLTTFRPGLAVAVVSKKSAFNLAFDDFEPKISGEILRMRGSLSEYLGNRDSYRTVSNEILRIMATAMERRPLVAIHPKSGQSAIGHCEMLILWSAICQIPSPLSDMVKSVYPVQGIPCGISADLQVVTVYCPKFNTVSSKPG